MRQRHIYWFFEWLFVSLFFMVAGCAHLPGKGKSEESLRQKVTQEWQAKVKGDWGTVYDLTTRNFKAAVNRDKFIHGASVKATGFEIKSITVTPDQDKAKVVVSMDIEHLQYSFKGAKSNEEWVWEDGEWRLNLNLHSTPFGGKEAASPSK